MCICMHIYVLCMHKCMCVSMCIYVCLSMCMCAYMCFCVYCVCMCAYICVMDAQVYVCKHVCICVCCVRICVCVHMYAVYCVSAYAQPVRKAACSVDCPKNPSNVLDFVFFPYRPIQNRNRGLSLEYKRRQCSPHPSTPLHITIPCVFPSQTSLQSVERRVSTRALR